MPGRAIFGKNKKSKSTSREENQIKKPTSQNLKILEAQKKGARLTPMDALHLCGCFRLSARIADLRMAGHKIFSHMVERNGKHVAEYYMGATRKLT